TMKQFEKHQMLIKDDVKRKRAKHADSENKRTKLAYQALSVNDCEKLGHLLNNSHASLKEDYNVTGIELDTLAETTQQVEDVLGARMTGAGFAGCAIGLVHKNQIQALEDEVSNKYIEKIGYEPSFYHVGISDGVKTI